MSSSINIEVGNDAEQAMLTQLMSNSVLRGLVAGQIYPSNLSQLKQSDIVFPVITFRQTASARGDWQEVFFPQVYQFNFWSKRGYNEAMRVRDAARAALHNTRLHAGDSVILMKVRNIGQNVFDPTASLYYCTSQTSMLTLDVSTPV